MDEFKVILIKKEELENMWDQNPGLVNFFKKFRNVCRNRGLSYSTKLSIKSWFDTEGNLRQQNFREDR